MMFSTGTIFLAASTIALLLCVVDNAVSGKKGVCAYAPYILCDDFRVLNNISWWYGWRDAYRLYDQHVTQKCPSPHAQMPEFVPMVWSIHSNESSRWIHIPPGSQFVLGYNEPDHVPQAHMTPQEAAMYWPMIEKAAVGISLVAPAPASHGFHWLDQFFHLCNSCRIDYVAAHSYLCNADQTMAYLKAMYSRYHKKVWLTEFACPHTPDEHVQLGLMRTLLPQLEADDFVYLY
ncbi:hypothetical protein DPMN_132707 [Dreissena polymorpha]|uniref:Asl1-like glycosyl hydrolase catalytic domain-containing protein n=1 Tax=Dreissena polymorpha TaxID=45954 RepID=A0A9D4FYU6_DREPO|nr:hypothetical protein DPMN_132707 [Dreissena polymorpha]